MRLLFIALLIALVACNSSCPQPLPDEYSFVHNDSTGKYAIYHEFITHDTIRSNPPSELVFVVGIDGFFGKREGDDLEWCFWTADSDAVYWFSDTCLLKRELQRWLKEEAGALPENYQVQDQ